MPNAADYDLYNFMKEQFPSNVSIEDLAQMHLLYEFLYSTTQTSQITADQFERTINLLKLDTNFGMLMMISALLYYRFNNIEATLTTMAADISQIVINTAV